MVVVLLVLILVALTWRFLLWVLFFVLALPFLLLGAILQGFQTQKAAKSIKRTAAREGLILLGFLGVGFLVGGLGMALAAFSEHFGASSELAQSSHRPVPTQTPSGISEEGISASPQPSQRPTRSTSIHDIFEESMASIGPATPSTPRVISGDLKENLRLVTQGRPDPPISIGLVVGYLLLVLGYLGYWLVKFIIWAVKTLKAQSQ